MSLSVVIYLPTLNSGGAERLHINLAPALVAKGFVVTLLVHRIQGALVDAVPPGVRLVSLECNRTLGALRPLVRFLKKERPNILLSNLGHTNIMAISARTLARVRTRVIVSHHNTLSSECYPERGWRYRMLPFMCRLFIGWAHGIVAVSEGVANDLAEMTGIRRDRITVIYNPVITTDFDSRMEESADHPWLEHDRPPVILAVGRLHPMKDFKTLISAFAIVAKQCDARLIILGEGSLRESLASHAVELGIANRVSMPGFLPNPLPFMRKASVLAMSSRYEGFGNVLVEALACGTPVVSTDCTFGPSEILDGGRFGRLVPVSDQEAMAGALLDTLKDPHPSDMLRKRGCEFTVDRAAILYADLFYRLVYVLPEFADPTYENPMPISYDRWHYR
jgi:glycosyltransferase involved in cell wall biosynthesis